MINNDALVTESDTNDTKNICRKCELLMELFTRTPKDNRDYWVMTELFVMLHDGKDYCMITSEFKEKDDK